MSSFSSCTNCHRLIEGEDDLCDTCKEFWHAAKSQAIMEYATELIEGYREEGIILMKDTLINTLVSIASGAGRLDGDLINRLKECGVEIPQ